MNNPYSKTIFLTSVAELTQLSPDYGTEIAFVGRSNVGKSSVLNALTEQKGLAKTSKTPGRTQLINFFQVDDHTRLVDLPGYGYAKVPVAIKERWQRILGQYLQTRACLRGLILIMDIRHPLTTTDQTMLELALEAQLFVHIVLNKADKLSMQAKQKTLREVQKSIAELATVQTFSALRHEGLNELIKTLGLWRNHAHKSINSLELKS